MNGNVTVDRERRVQPSILPSNTAFLGVRRISWGSVIAGTIMAMVVQVAMSALGIGIGASTVDLSQPGGTPTTGLGVGAAVWFVISALVSLYIGGWVAGRLAGIPRRLDSALHGLLTWGLTTILSMLMLTTAVGGILGGAASVLGKGLSIGGQSAAQIAGSQGGAASDIRQQAGNLADRAQDAVRSATNQVSGAEAEQTARQAGDTAAKGVSAAGFLTFAMLALGALAAGIGGGAGRATDIRGVYSSPTV